MSPRQTTPIPHPQPLSDVSLCVYQMLYQVQEISQFLSGGKREKVDAVEFLLLLVPSSSVFCFFFRRLTAALGSLLHPDIDRLIRRKVKLNLLRVKNKKK